jgi:hypothetical protein
MAAESNGGSSGKVSRRPAAKAAKAVARQAAPKVKTTVHLSAEASERLGIHAVKMRMDRSELVEWLIQQHLRRYVVSDRGESESGNAGTAESLNS